MSSVRTYLLFPTLVIITLSCSTSERVNGESSINVVQTTVNAWFNLMPGPSPGKFNLQGEIKLANSNSVDIENLNLESITVYSNEEVIYTFKPYFSPLVKDDDYSLNAGNSKEFSFGSDSGMKIDSWLEESNIIDVRLNLAFDEDNFKYEIKDVEIMWVY
jgi:hypothetical protein